MLFGSRLLRNKAAETKVSSLYIRLEGPVLTFVFASNFPLSTEPRS